jgi:ABC-type transport system involved in Fe-S cluster assembly fused permease/ATPase subunit
LPLLEAALSPTCGAAEREASEVALRKACSEAQILDFIEGLPSGFNTQVSTSLFLSHNMKTFRLVENLN